MSILNLANIINVVNQTVGTPKRSEL